MNLSEAKSILENNGFILTKNQLNENTIYGIDSKKWEEMRKNYDYYTGDQIHTRNNGRIYCLTGCGGAIKGPGDFGEIVNVDNLNHKIKFKDLRTNETYEYNIDTKPNWEGYAGLGDTKCNIVSLSSVNREGGDRAPLYGRLYLGKV